MGDRKGTLVERRRDPGLAKWDALDDPLKAS